MSCQPCHDEINRWVDTSPHMFRGLRFASHASYDDTPAGVRNNRTARWERWRDLVNAQTRLILDQCARDHTPGQAALFELEAA
jgi:hypothetical protein